MPIDSASLRSRRAGLGSPIDWEARVQAAKAVAAKARVRGAKRD